MTSSAESFIPLFGVTFIVMAILELTVDVTDLQNASSICAGCMMHTEQTDDALGANARCVFADKALMSIKGCYII